MNDKITQIDNMMRQSMNGKIPHAAELAESVFPELLLRHVGDRAFAMPREGGALDEEIRTLIYLGIALATNSHACVEAMMNKAHTLQIGRDKLLETFKIARFAEATRVFGNAERMFEMLQEQLA